MKRIKFLSLLAIFFGTVLFLSSCEEPIPDCERYSYGDITIENQTGFSLWFALDDYSEFKLYDGGSKSYYNESTGTHYFYYYDDFYETWYYDTEHLSSCEDLTFTWYISKKKSTGSGVYLEISRDGEVIHTLTEFKITNRKNL